MCVRKRPDDCQPADPDRTSAQTALPSKRGFFRFIEQECEREEGEGLIVEGKKQLACYGCSRRLTDTP